MSTSTGTDAADGQLPDLFEGGGIVRRYTQGDLRIAVVHRKRYDGDWTLPKGHRNAGETLLDAAVREVREEAACIAKSAELAGVINYQTTEGTKYVVFWWMDYSGAVNGPSDPEEVASVHWLQPEDARQKLTYPQQARLLAPLLDSQGAIRNRWYHRTTDRTNRWYQRIAPANPARGSLAVAIDRARTEQRATGRYPRDNPAWLDAAERLIDGAESHLGKRQYDQGWALLQLAHQFEIQGFSHEQCDAEAAEIRIEAASKLVGWRRVAVLEHLDPGYWARAQDDERKVRLASSLRVRDGSYANEYRDLALLRRYQAILLWIATPIIAVLVAGFIVFSNQLGPGTLPEPWWIAVSTVLLGALGGITSAAQRVTRQGPRTRMPLRLGVFVSSLSRPAIGAIAGLTAYLGALAGFLVPTNNPVPFALLAAFGSGFTERLVVGKADDLGRAPSAGSPVDKGG